MVFTSGARRFIKSSIWPKRKPLMFTNTNGNISQSVAYISNITEATDEHKKTGTLSLNMKRLTIVLVKVNTNMKSTLL